MSSLKPFSILLVLTFISLNVSSQSSRYTVIDVPSQPESSTTLSNLDVKSEEKENPPKGGQPEIFGMRKVKQKNSSKIYNVYDAYDPSKIYRAKVNKSNCFIVISKREFRLYVYEIVNRDTLLAAHFPVCVALNPGDKHRSGDGTTPICSKDRNGNYIPFTISEILSSSSWRHDFKDGRGNILAYGDWFMRLRLHSHPYVSSNRSIGIHGSSNNPLSVPGRDSEGCIRLLNDDLNILKSSYAQKGMPVIIKPETAEKSSYELRAQSKAPGYQVAVRGYRLPSNSQFVD